MFVSELITSPVAGGSQQVSYNNTSAQSAVLNEGLIDVSATTACWIRIGVNPIAVKGVDYFLCAPNMPFRFRVGIGCKLSVIRDSSDGVLTICPVS